MNVNRKPLQIATRELFSIESWQKPVAFTLTLKRRFKSDRGWVQVDSIAASRALKHCINKVQRRLFKRTRGKPVELLKVLPVQEARDGRLHYHLAVDCPKSVSAEKLVATLLQNWCSLQEADREADFVIHCDAAWISYMTKLKSKPDFGDSIDWMNFSNSQS